MKRIKLTISPEVSTVLQRLGENSPAKWEELAAHLIAVGLGLPTAFTPGYLPAALYIVPSPAMRTAVSGEADPRAALEAALEKGAAIARQGNVTS